MSKPIRIVRGVPTDADVKALMTAFPDLTPGTTILHSAVENIIQAAKDSPRYRTVVNAWKKRLMLERNIDWKAVAGVGFLILEEVERVTESVRDYAKGARKIGRAVRRIGAVRTEVLTQDEQRRAEHARRHMEGSLSAIRKTSKEIAIAFKPTDQLPKWKPEK